MNKRKRVAGISVLEVLIASSLFSVFVVQTILYSVRVYATTYQTLQRTQAIIASEWSDTR